MPGRLRRLRRQNNRLRERIDGLTRRSQDLTAPLTPQRLKKETNAAARLRYGGEERELEGQQRASDAQQQRIGDWYGQYQRVVQDATARQQAAQQQANAAILALQGGTGATTTPDVPAGGEAAAADAQAALARKASVGSFGAMLATQGANRDAFMADKGRIGAGDETQQHLDESGRRRTIDQGLQELMADKGAFKIAHRADARESERRYALERAAFGLQEQKLAVDTALSRAAQRSLDSDRKQDNRRQRRQERRDNMEADRKYQLDVEKFGSAQAKERYQRRHKIGPYSQGSGSGSDKDGDGKPDLSPSEIRTRRKERRQAWTEANTAAADMETLSKSPYTDDKGTKEEEDDVQRAASREETFAALRRSPYNYSQDQILVAYALYKKTPTWDAKTIAAAKRLGIKVPKKYLPSGYSKGEGRPD